MLLLPFPGPALGSDEICLLLGLLLAQVGQGEAHISYFQPQLDLCSYSILSSNGTIGLMANVGLGWAKIAFMWAKLKFR